MADKNNKINSVIDTLSSMKNNGKKNNNGTKSIGSVKVNNIPKNNAGPAKNTGTSAKSSNVNTSPISSVKSSVKSTVTSSIKGVASKTSKTYNSMGPLTKIWILLIFILIIIVLVYWVKSIKYSAKWKNKYEPVLISNPMNAYNAAFKKQSITIPNSEDGLSFTYSFWIYIADWNYNFGKFKNIISKGNDNVGYSPGIWLYPNTNSLHARIATFADPNEGCDIQNIPLQKWCCITYVLNTRTVDIYINGKLERSCVLKGVPHVNNSPLKVCQNGGFYGQISRLQYFAKAINPNKIKQIYREGPFGSTKYKIKFFQDGKFVQSTPDSSVLSSS